MSCYEFIMINDQTKAPRLYCGIPLNNDAQFPLPDEQSHYLLTVLRKNDGDFVRVFNGRGGEWLARIVKAGKRKAELQCVALLKTQQNPAHRTHLFFAPIKKDRLAFMLEKAVELGATDLHPVLTDRTENRHFNAERAEKQIIEAAEQCERMDIPALHPAIPLPAIGDYPLPISAALERDGDLPFMACKKPAGDTGFLVGPEGGWTEAETAMLKDMPMLRPVSLGARILRSETAAIYMLARSAGEEATPPAG